MISRSALCYLVSFLSFIPTITLQAKDRQNMPAFLSIFIIYSAWILIKPFFVKYITNPEQNTDILLSMFIFSSFHNVEQNGHNYDIFHL